MTPPTCDCHGLPKTWFPDKRKKSGGFWCCRERDLENRRRRYHANPAPVLDRMARRFRERYDNDPIWRIERNMKRAREKRAETQARRRQRLEELRG